MSCQTVLIFGLMWNISRMVYFRLFSDYHAVVKQLSGICFVHVFDVYLVDVSYVWW
jgi:hypothetical protein